MKAFSRRINSQPLLLGDGGVVPPDTYLGRLIKYVPTEIVALYLAVTGPIAPTDVVALSIVSVVVLACTPLYICRVTQDSEVQEVMWSQIIISTLATALWIFAIGGPFASCAWYQHDRWIRTVAIVFGTFFLSLYSGRKRDIGGSPLVADPK